MAYQGKHAAQHSAPVYEEPSVPEPAAFRVPAPEPPKSKSVAAIVGLVLGILALLTSFLPFINNFSFFIAAIGFIFALVGTIGTLRGKRSGKVLAIVALIINIAAIAIVLVTQSAYSKAIDDATSGADVTAVESSDDSSNDASDSKSEAADERASTDLAVGASVTLDNGLQVTVDSVTPGLTNYDGSTITGVHVTYVNNGDDAASFNEYDWKGEDAGGKQSNCTYYSEAQDQLSSGSIAAGGTASGSIYFDGDLSKVLYYSSMLTNDATASWNLQ